MEYRDEDLLMLSGVQHIAFCERQWAMIHIEQQWQENLLTTEGRHLHERVDDPLESGLRGNVLTLRSVPLLSRQLGLTGKADAVEFIKSADGAKLTGHEGRWQPRPVEYKRGRPKPDERDAVQLCAQAICLEERYALEIPEASLYYGETRHRQNISLDESLREQTKAYAERMHELYRKGETPKPVYKKHCRACSFYDLCMPKQLAKAKSVSRYLNNNLNPNDEP
jgi:CRISPR-associated exonuclease Cas4